MAIFLLSLSGGDSLAGTKKLAQVVFRENWDRFLFDERFGKWLFDGAKEFGVIYILRGETNELRREIFPGLLINGSAAKKTFLARHINLIWDTNKDINL